MGYNGKAYVQQRSWGYVLILVKKHLLSFKTHNLLHHPLLNICDVTNRILFSPSADNH